MRGISVSANATMVNMIAALTCVPTAAPEARMANIADQYSSGGVEEHTPATNANPVVDRP